MSFIFTAAGTDYVEPAGAFVLRAGQTRACLSITLNSDNLFEDVERLSGRLIGTVEQQGGQVTMNPPRVTFDPDETVISIRDDPSESTSSEHRVVLLAHDVMVCHTCSTQV